MERAAAIIVGSVGGLVLTIAALFWVASRGTGSGRTVDLLAGPSVSVSAPVSAGSSPGATTANSSRASSVTATSGPSSSTGSTSSVAPVTSLPVTSLPVTSLPVAATAPPVSATLAGLLARANGGGIRFAYRSAELEPSARALLDELAAALIAEPAVHLSVAGHTDSDGTASDNVVLSALRAAAVIDHLTGRGVPAAQLSARALGASDPVAPNDDEAGRQANRRSELEVDGVHP